jgi:hypothetical protein
LTRNGPKLTLLKLNYKIWALCYNFKLTLLKLNYKIWALCYNFMYFTEAKPASRFGLVRAANEEKRNIEMLALNPQKLSLLTFKDST